MYICTYVCTYVRMYVHMWWSCIGILMNVPGFQHVVFLVCRFLDGHSSFICHKDTALDFQINGWGMLAELEQLQIATHLWARQGMMRICTLSNASRLFTWFRVRGDVHERGRSRDAGAGEVLRLWDFWKETKYNGILISTSAIIWQYLKSITYISYHRNMGYCRTGIVICSSVSTLWRQIANGTYFLINVKVYGPFRWKSSLSYNTR